MKIKLTIYSLLLLAIFAIVKIGLSYSYPSTTVQAYSKGLFIDSSGNQRDVYFGRSIAEQIPKTGSCCKGVYKLQIDTQTPSVEGIYISSAGGLRSVSIEGNTIFKTNDNFSDVGPVIPITPAGKMANLEIEIDSPRTNYSGVWRGQIYAGKLSHLIAQKDSETKNQIYLPLVDALITAILSLSFFIVHAVVRSRKSFFKKFAFTLLTWSLFFLSLSGSFRNISFAFGLAVHLPLRTLAAYTSLNLSEDLIGYRATSKIKVAFLISVLLQLTFAGAKAYDTQLIVFVATGLLSLDPIIRSSLKNSFAYQKISYALYLVFIVGQTSDAAKLLLGNSANSYPIPYLNRYSLLPFLGFSFVFAVIEFAATFKALGINLFRARQTSLFGLRISRQNPNTKELVRIAKKYRKLYTMEAVYGETSKGEMILLSGREIQGFEKTKLRAVQPTIMHGEGSMYCLRKFKIEQTLYSATELSIDCQELEYKCLVGIKSPIDISDDTVNPIYMVQILSLLRVAIQKATEQNKRLEAEEKFKNLIQKLDPNLFDYVQKNYYKANLDYSSSQKGIIFFDQKGYTTLLENLDEKRAFELAEIVNRWVSEKTAKYAARIRNFNGDAYTLEMYSLPDEQLSDMAKRLCSLVWEFVASLDELNRTLLRHQFDPITFRFGANIGTASDLKLDFINPGLSNIIGDNVNVAARLQSLARPGSVYVSGELASLVDSQYEFRRVPRSYVKGRRREVEVFELIGKIIPNDQKGAA